MANQYKKITDLPSMTSGDVDNSTDLLAIVDVSEDETKASTLDTFIISTLNGGTFIGSFSGSFQGDGSGITGVESEWDGSHLGDASITGSFIISGSGTTINLTEVENGVSGSFFGIFSGSFYGDGSGLTGLTADTASYVLSSNVEGPLGMNSILSASYAVSSSSTISSSYAISSSSTISSSYAISSSSTISSSYALTASYYDGPSGVFTQTGSFYATTNDLQVTGSFNIDTPSSEQLIVSGNMDVGGRLDNSGSIVYELGPSLEAGANGRNFLNGEIGGFTDPNAIYQSGSNTYLYEQQGWSTTTNTYNQMDISPFTGSEYVGQCIRVWYKDFNDSDDAEQSLFRFRRGSGVTWDLNNLTISAGDTVDIQAQNPISGSYNTNIGIFYGGSGSMCEIYCIGENEYFAVSTGIPNP